MRVPTEEQRTILKKRDARVRIVRAVPGSGKTWLIAELIRQELDLWPTETKGIAALSFTKIAGEEIRKAVGHELGHPHFVGTIDAFLFRYILRPHLCHVFKHFAEPRIIAGEWGPQYWGMRGRNQSATFGNGKINLFGCIHIGEKMGKAITVYKPHPNLPFRHLTVDESDAVRKAKIELWKTRGLFTHSDASFWASRILEDPSSGPIIRSEIVRRFPLLIVDELQDTGYFLGKSIQLLLEQSAARGVLVGDPDQAIYEFNGAKPDLFDDFETISGAVSLPLSTSRRCPPLIAQAASHLKDGKGIIQPAEERAGRAFLLRYQNMIVDIRNVVEALQKINGGKEIKVVARGTTTVDGLRGRHTKTTASLHCPALTHIHRAVVKFRQGKTIAALGLARAAIERATFNCEGMTDEELEESKIDVIRWKELAVRCLLKVNAISDAGIYLDWQTRAAQILDKEISLFAISLDLDFVAGKLKPKRVAGWQSQASDFLPQSGCGQSPTGIPAQTVHGVKGETHSVTIFVCPRPAKVRHCPSRIWWSPEEQDREEKRIAYVAMTRTQGDLILCVTEDCYKRLATSQPVFIESFICMTVKDFLASSAQSILEEQPLTLGQSAGKL